MYVAFVLMIIAPFSIIDALYHRRRQKTDGAIYLFAKLAAA